MVNVEMLESSVAVVRPTGKLSASDFAAIAQHIDPIIDAQGKLRGLVLEVEKFPGWENLNALTTHLRFVGAHHRAIRRIALVSDAAIAGVVPRLANRFVTAEIRHFPSAQAAEARSWAAQGD